MESRILVSRDDRSLTPTDDVQPIKVREIHNLCVSLDLTPPNDIDHGVARLELATKCQPGVDGIRWNVSLLHPDGCVASQKQH